VEFVAARRPAEWSGGWKAEVPTWGAAHSTIDQQGVNQQFDMGDEVLDLESTWTKLPVRI
jgi:hypothetical protein